MDHYLPPVTGTDIWYYFICKRELWLMLHEIAPNEEDENVEIGRFLQDYYGTRGKEEVDIGAGKIDRLKKVKGEVIVQEIKKSSKFKESSRFQLLFYLYQFEKMGVQAVGELTFAEERRKERVELTEENRQKLMKAVEHIRKIAKQPVPPPPKKIKFCRQCAYREYCWAGE
ncbi:MAG: CRISPR-associated protein Cas4 [Desulfotomaculum sp.]|nr:CRISPR-associated protein Cas4 [Desulfotomaculum sp.]